MKWLSLILSRVPRGKGILTLPIPKSTEFTLQGQHFLSIIKPCSLWGGGRGESLTNVRTIIYPRFPCPFIYLWLKREQIDPKANTCILVFVKFDRNLSLSNLDRSRIINTVLFRLFENGSLLPKLIMYFIESLVEHL